MSFFDFFFCIGCKNSNKIDITADVDISSLEILSINRDIIAILLETKVSLNCTNYRTNDCLYLYANPRKIPINFTTISNSDFLIQNKIKLESESGYTIVNKAELNIKPGIYNIFYLRNNAYLEEEEKNKAFEWKILGNSPAFKLDILSEEINKENSLKSTKSSEEHLKKQKNSKKNLLDDSENYSKLKTELLENQSLNETFLPLNPKPLNLNDYYMNPTVSKYRKVKKQINKENKNPNFSTNS